MLVIADQLVVGVFQFHFGDRGVETLDHMHAGLVQGAHRHQGGAGGDLAARAVGFGLAGIVGDLADRDAHRALADKAAHAAQGRGIGGFVGDHRRAADRRGVAADGVGRRADAAFQRDRGQHQDQRLEEMFACAAGHGRGFPSFLYTQCVFTAAVAVWLPVLICWLSMIVVLWLPMTVTLSELPIAVACPYAHPLHRPCQLRPWRTGAARRWSRSDG